MRYWKSVSLLLLIAALAGACSSTPDATSEEASNAPDSTAADKPKAEAPKPIVIPADTKLSVTYSNRLR